MSFGELTAIVGDMLEQKSHGGGVLISSHLDVGWRGGVQIGELTDIGELSIPCCHGAVGSLIWVTQDIGDVSFIVARKFWSDK